MAGVQPSGVERAVMRRTFVANLAWAAELAAPAGVELLIEPINTRDMPGYFLNRQDEAHAIVERSAILRSRCRWIFITARLWKAM